MRFKSNDKYFGDGVSQPDKKADQILKRWTHGYFRQMRNNHGCDEPMPAIWGRLQLDFGGCSLAEKILAGDQSNPGEQVAAT